MQEKKTEEWMAHSRFSSGWFLLVLGLLSCVVLFSELGRMDIVTDNEGQRATPPLEMLQSGNYVIPTINGEAYLVKPPLLYWMIAGVYRVTGVISPLNARIPTAICGLVLVLCVYFFVRSRGHENAARWTALGLLIAPYMVERMRLAQLDVSLGLMVFLAIWFMNNAQHGRTMLHAVLWSLAGGVALGAAFLIKGPAPAPFIGAAWGVHLILTGPETQRAMRHGLRWSITALILTFILYYLSLALFLLHGPETTEGVLVGLRKLVSMPWGLALAGLVWAWWVLLSLRGRWLRQLPILFIVIGTGAAVVLPWVLAVVADKGLNVVEMIIRTEFVDRTHTATMINSGSPFYYVLALPFMLAPLGLLFPLQCSPRLWEKAPYLYRFGLLTGWLSVLAFSLVAGKEYEYVLPAFPLLLIPAGFLLSGYFAEEEHGWIRQWRRKWLTFFTFLLPVAAGGLAIYITIDHPVPRLLLEAWGCAIGVWVLILAGRRIAGARQTLLILATLLTVMIGIFSRSWHYTGDRSPQELARLMGDLARSGYRVETCRMPPAFAFYARTPIPVEMDPEAILRRLQEKEPYYYVVREKFVKEMRKAGFDAPAQSLFGPVTSKSYELWGNQPLPEMNRNP